MTVLENRLLALRFDRGTGTLAALKNKLTRETYRITGDEFVVETEGFRLGAVELTVVSRQLDDHAFEVHYECDEMTVQVVYTLHAENHFAAKPVALIFNCDHSLREVILGWPSFSCDGLQLVQYSYQKNVTYFGRTDRDGFFTGVELPFDTSRVEGNRVTLGYSASLKVKAGERVECEPVYFGLYKRYPGEKAYLDEAIGWCDHFVDKGAIPVTTSKGNDAFWWWDVGNKNLYLADTGTAAYALFKAYPHVDLARRQKYLGALEKVHLLIAEGTDRDPMDMASGLHNVLFDELRVSNVERVQWDGASETYPVPEASYATDAHTLLLMHFDGDFTGTGKAGPFEATFTDRDEVKP